MAESSCQLYLGPPGQASLHAYSATNFFFFHFISLHYGTSLELSDGKY